MTSAQNVVIPLIFLSLPAFAQEGLPWRNPEIQLSVCQDMRAIYISDSEKLQTYLRQSSAEIADLKRKLAEAEAKLVPPAPPKAE